MNPNDPPPPPPPPPPPFGEDAEELSLMAFVDGRLAAPEADALRARLATEPALRERMAAYVATRDLGPLYWEAAARPMPEALRSLISAPLPGRRTAADPGTAAGGGLLRALSALFSPGRGWAIGLASTCLILGSAGGWMAYRMAGDDGYVLATGNGGALVAGPLLGKALETGLSVDPASPVEIEGKAAAVTTGTFMSQDGRPCRQYRFAVTGGSRSRAGIACRDAGGRWTVEVDVATGVEAGKPESIRSASGPVLDAAVESMAKGEALSRNDERDLISRGWR